MIIEQVTLSVPDERGAAFRNAVLENRTFIETVASFEMRRSVEAPDRYRFLVRWNSVDDHNAYRGTEEFKQFTGGFRSLIGTSHGMEHYLPSNGDFDTPRPDKLLETVTLSIENAEGFEKALPEIMKHRLGAPGQAAMEFRKCLETPNRYALFAYWDNIEAHTVLFRGSPDYPLFTGALRPYFTPPVSVEHWTSV